jgi:ribose transport system permease protein
MPARLRALFRFQESGLLLVILALGALLTAFAGTVRTPVFERAADGTRTRVYTTDTAGERVPLTSEKNKFLNAQNLAQLAKDTSFIAIMAVGMALVIISGGIDLTVGAIYALASVAGALVLRHFGAQGPAATSPILGILLGTGTCLGVATLCGLASGSLIVALGVHPFIITLGGMAIYRGIAFVITEGQSIGSFPAAFREFVRFEVGDGLGVVPLATMIFVLFAGWIFLSRLAAGRRVYAIGGNENAARAAGISVGRVKLFAYVICGLLTGLAGVVLAARITTGQPNAGQAYELDAIAAVVIGLIGVMALVWAGWKLAIWASRSLKR